MFRNLFLLSICFLLIFILPASSAAARKKEARRQQGKPASSDTTKKPEGKILSYEDFFKKPVVSDTGLFIIHRSDHRFYFEVPDTLLGKDMLIVSRRAAMSSSDFDPMVAGEKAQDGLMVQWDKSPDGKDLLLKKVTSRNLLRFSGKDSAFARSVALQTLDPILLSIPIKARGAGGVNAIIDIAPLYLADIKELTPFAADPIRRMLGLPDNKKYKLETGRSFIESAKSFRKNIEVRSLLTFTEKDHTYTILMNRSMVLLPEDPMRPRIADDRVGYFYQHFNEFNESSPVKQEFYIKRWRLEPRPEDRARMQRGIPVEPRKPIVFYIDAATPEKWRPYIRQGVEDWLPAFEAAGFKNAIQAKDVPVNDSDFHPEDIRYSVIRYAASRISNARGPSVSDPRTGEILESDIIIYHNILKLLEDWRFSQTAANDPRVRSNDMPDSVIGESLRYVVAHEVGHALGLRHNMGASYAFPVDSLRSPGFTQRYGTTPSIMDYARNNYVAQPEDTGVKLTPPHLGIYDKYAIHWGYAPIPEAGNPREEIPVLNQWIELHQDDPRYRFAEGDVNGSDPSSQRESLGDNVVKASEYGVKNARYIIAHMDQWLKQPGDNYDDINERYRAVLQQYERYLTQVGHVIAGVYQHYAIQGADEKAYAYPDKQKQQDAVAFLLRQYRELPSWIENKDLQQKVNIINQKNAVKKILPLSSYLGRLYKISVQRDLLNNGKLAYLIDNRLANGDTAYSARDLLDDIRGDFFKETEQKRSPGYYVRLLQSIYVDRLMNIARFTKAGYASEDHVAGPAVTGDFGSASCFNPDDGQLPSLRYDPDVAGRNLYFQFMDFTAHDKQFKIASLALEELKKVRSIVRKGLKSSSGPLYDHYAFLLKSIDQYLDKP